MATGAAASSSGVKGGKATPVVKGVALDKVKEPVVDRFLAKFGLPMVGTLADKVNRLAEHIRRLTPNPERNIVECDNCDGPSCAGGTEKVSTDVCPFCGDGDDSTGVVRPAAKANGKEPVTTLVTDAKGAPIKAALAVREQRVEAAKAAAPVGYQKLMLRFQAARAKVVISYWELGRICSDIFSEKAYLEARDEAGKPKYSSFEQFCQAEIKMTPQNVYRLMRVSVVFTPEQVQVLGTCKLDLLLKVSDEDERRELLARAEKMPLSELELQILGRTDRKAIAKDEDDDSGAERSTPAPRGLTTTFTLGRTRLKAWSRGDATRRARSLGDDPWATWELPNGVTQRIVLVRSVSGELEFLVEVTKGAGAPKGPAKAPKGPAKAPKGAEGGKGAPKAPKPAKGAPKPAKGAPKPAKGAPKAPKPAKGVPKAPKPAKGVPKAHKGPAKASKRAEGGKGPAKAPKPAKGA